MFHWGLRSIRTVAIRAVTSCVQNGLNTNALTSYKYIWTSQEFAYDYFNTGYNHRLSLLEKFDSRFMHGCDMNGRAVVYQALYLAHC
jgi:hypothetical protein